MQCFNTYQKSSTYPSRFDHSFKFVVFYSRRDDLFQEKKKKKKKKREVKYALDVSIAKISYLRLQVRETSPGAAKDT